MFYSKVQENHFEDVCLIKLNLKDKICHPSKKFYGDVWLIKFNLKIKKYVTPPKNATEVFRFIMLMGVRNGGWWEWERNGNPKWYDGFSLPT